MEMLARFERGESEGGGSGDASSVNGLEEVLKGMGGWSQDDDGTEAHIEEEDDEDGFAALEALKTKLSENPDLGMYSFCPCPCHLGPHLCGHSSFVQ